MNKRYWYTILIMSMLYACTQDSTPELISLDLDLTDLIEKAAPLNGGLDFYILPDESDLAAIPQDSINNPLNPAKVELGKFLFFETGFAMNAVKPEGIGTYSCGSCHIPEAGFKSGMFQGIADGGDGYGIKGEDRVRSDEYIPSDLDVQSIRPLSLLNVAYVKNTLWNGRFGAEGYNEGTEDLWKESDGTHLNELGFKAIETQNLEGLETHRILITEALIDEYGYRELFDEAFPDLSEGLRYSNWGGSLAMSAYIRTLLSNQAPFQDWLKGDRFAMSVEEKKGAILFFGKANCSNCHYNQNLGSSEFHALGVEDMDMRPFFKTTDSEIEDRNLGRGAFTGDLSDNYKFKVPQLYNQSDSPFFFHGSSVPTLEALIEYKNVAETESDRVPQELLSTKFLPLNLSEEEKQQLLTFLEVSLRDPNLIRYKPTSIKSGFCFPNNDENSKVDLGCN